MGSLELKGFICYSPQSDALSSAKTLREAFSSKGAIYFVEIEEETQNIARIANAVQVPICLLVSTSVY